MTSTEILGLDEIASSDRDKFITHNVALRQIEGQRVRILSRTNGGPPVTPNAGDTYIVDVLSGDWTSATLGDVAHYYSSLWFFYTPAEGIQRLWVMDEDVAITYDGAAWVNEAAASMGISALTPGSVVFAGTSSLFDEDAANLYWDNVNKFLGIGTNTPTETVTIDGSLGQDNTLNPSVKGTVFDGTNLNQPLNVFVRGDYAYLACGTGDSLTIVDVSDRTTPAVTGQLIDSTNINAPTAVFIVGDYAYVSCADGDSLTIVDVSDPTAPVLAGSLVDGTNLNEPQGVIVIGGLAYVVSATGDSLAIVDVSDPTAPVLVGSLIDAANLNGAHDIKVVGNYAYIPSTNSNQLAIVDVSDPTAPVLEGTLIDGTNLAGPRDIDIRGKYCYVGCAGGITIVNITDPNSPTITGQVLDGTNLNAVRGISISGNYAYCAARDDNRVTIVDVSDPTAPAVKGSFQDGTNLQTVTSIFISGKYAYAASEGGNRLTIMEINGTRLTSADIGNIKTHHIEVDQEAQVGYLLSRTGGEFGGDAAFHKKIKVSDTASFNSAIEQMNTKAPTVVGSLQDGTNLNSPFDVFVRGDYAYVVSQTGDSLAIVDVSDPTAPVLEGTLIDGTNLNGAFGVHVVGNYAYVACNVGNSVAIVDVSDPTTPVFVGGIVDGTNLNGVTYLQCVGPYVYVTAQTGDRLTVIDVSDVTAPTVAGSVTHGTNLNSPTGLDIVGNYCYVACGTGDSLTVVDVTNPESPTITGQLIDATNLNGCNGVKIQGKYAYTACGVNRSLTILDISDPTTPVFVSSVVDSTNFNGAFSVAIAGNYAYLVSETGNSVAVIDVSDPTAPVVKNVIVDATNLPGLFGSILSGGYLYVASQSGNRLTVVDINGARLTSADIGNIKTHHIEVDQEAQVGYLSSKGGISVGGPIRSQGAIDLTGTIGRMFRARSTDSCYFDLDSGTNKNAGFRFYKDGTFKWQIYNDGDASDNLAIEDAAGGIIFNLTQAGILSLQDAAGPAFKLVRTGSANVVQLENDGTDCRFGSTATTGKLKLLNNNNIIAEILSSGMAIKSGTLTVDNGQLLVPGHNTTASAANAFLESSGGELKRSTSSRRFKREIEDAQPGELTTILDEVRVVTYKSRIKTDNPDTVHLGLIAEETHPLLTFYDDKGRPNGVQYERVALLAISELQDVRKRISKLEDSIEKLLLDKE